jgi:glycosyltransferase involved in cell wall biosynthesis
MTVRLTAREAGTASLGAAACRGPVPPVPVSVPVMGVRYDAGASRRLAEVVGDASALVSPHDVDTIAREMARLWQDEPVRRELAARGLERVRTFAWEKTASQTLSVYTRL